MSLLTDLRYHHATINFLSVKVPGVQVFFKSELLNTAKQIVGHGLTLEERLRRLFDLQSVLDTFSRLLPFLL